MKTETIAAVATASGKAGVAIIRLSGPKSLQIASSFFKSSDKTIKPRYLMFGEINQPEIKEQCLMVYFKAPNSFTGEDVVEIQCHGGSYITQAILDLCIKNGARMAEPGEFSKRAFVNGKVSLDSAEGVVDLINSQTAVEAKASFSLFSGQLFKTIKKLQDTMKDCIADIEVNLDYPEHDIEYETSEKINKRLKKIEEQLMTLASTQHTGRLIKEGVNVLILGRPNVGKSSLLNALLDYERAIVTDIAGTTRDTISDTYIYKGIRFNITDTAGLRQSKNKIEKIGIKKAVDSIDRSDIILLVLDASEGILPDDIKNMQLIENYRYITVINKVDLNKNFQYVGDYARVSALKKFGIEDLKEKIYQAMIDSETLQNSIILTNKRHYECIATAIKHIMTATDNIFRISLDCTALDIKLAWEALGQITGENTSEDIVDAIFSKFCLGK